MDPSKMTRWRTTATTWVSKSVALLCREHEEARNDGERWLAGYDAAMLIHGVVGELRMLVPLIQDEPYDDLGDALREARALAAELRARQLVTKLERVEGRGPEEAAFRAKAAELRGSR